MTALPPEQGPDPVGEMADWLRVKLPKLTRQFGESLRVLGLSAGRVADKLAERLAKRDE